MALTRAQKSDLCYVESKVAGGNVSKAYFKHGVLYGNYFDLRIYKDVKITFKHDTNCNKTKSKEGGKRDDSVSRARVNLYRLITANIGQHGRYRATFGTYTFKDNVTRIDEANLRFKLYLARLSEHIGYRPKYVCVPETQKRGAWHFHVIFFNLPKLGVKVNDKLWKQGESAANIQYIKGVRNIGAYLSKYLSKEMIMERGINKKMYYTSRGLIRPQDVFHTDAIDNIILNGNVKVLSTYEGQTFTQLKYKLL